MRTGTRRQDTLDRLSRIDDQTEVRIGRVISTLLVHIGDEEISRAANRVLGNERSSAGPPDKD